MKKIIPLMCIVVALLGACRGGSDTFEARTAEAEAQMGLGNYLQALAALRAIEKDFQGDPRRFGILLKMADINANGMHDHDAALKLYGRVIEEEPLSEAARIAREKRAELRERSGDFEGAIEDYSALLKLFDADGKNQLYRTSVAGVYLSMRDYRQARVELKPLFKDDSIPEDVLEKAIFLAAESYFLEGKSKRASGYYRWLLEEFPKSDLVPEAKMHLATCYEEMGYLGVAGDIIESVSKVYPNERVVKAKKESLRARGKNPVGEVRFLKKADKKTPASSEDDAASSEKPAEAGEKSLQSGEAPLASPRS